MPADIMYMQVVTNTGYTVVWYLHWPRQSWDMTSLGVVIKDVQTPYNNNAHKIPLHTST